MSDMSIQLQKIDLMKISLLLKLKLKLKPVYLHHRYITMKIIGINYYMLQKRDLRSNCF